MPYNGFEAGCNMQGRHGKATVTQEDEQKTVHMTYHNDPLRLTNITQSGVAIEIPYLNSSGMCSTSNGSHAGASANASANLPDHVKFEQTPQPQITRSSHVASSNSPCLS